MFWPFKKRSEPDAGQPTEQAVLVYLIDDTLPDEVYEEYDVSTLGEQLEEVIRARGVGEYDGDEFGPDGTVLYMYGPDADRLFAAIEPTLRAYPLCRNARVVVRYGEPGAREREIRL